MKRYQVYLDPHSVSLLDDLASVSGIERSHLIRAAVDSLSENLSALLPRQVLAKAKKRAYFNTKGDACSGQVSGGILLLNGLGVSSGTKGARKQATLRKKISSSYATKSDSEYFGV